MKKLMVLLTIMVLAGCGKANSLLAPHQEVVNPPSPGANYPQLQMQLRAAPQLADAPVVGDPLFLVFARNWQTPLPIGTIDSTGNITGTTPVMVDAYGEDHSIRLYFERRDQPTGQVVKYPVIGQVKVNGTLLTGIDQSQVYNQWMPFIASRDDSLHVRITPIGDNSAQQLWTEIIVTGQDPDSTNTPHVMGDKRMWFASTFSSLESLPGIFDNNSWKGIVMAIRGRDFIFRATDESSGNLMSRGVYVKNGDGGLVLCHNLFNLGDSQNFFPAYIMHLNDDGTWSNLRPADERSGILVFGTRANQVLSARFMQPKQ